VDALPFQVLQNQAEDVFLKSTLQLSQKLWTLYGNYWMNI